MNEKYTNLIQKHTYSIPSLVCDSANSMFMECNEEIKKIDITKINSLIITGCGYSYAAALSIKHYIQELIEIPVEVVTAIEYSRFFSETVFDYSKALLIAISNSGEVSRIIEAAARHKSRGGQAIGLSAVNGSTLAEHVDCNIDISSPSIGTGLPLRGYAMTILALLGIGYAIKANKYNFDQSISNQCLEILKKDMQLLEKYLPDIDRKTEAFCVGHTDCTSFEYVGSGFERAAAFLGKIEMLGQAGMVALDEDSEQWCHCNFFLAAPEKIGTVLFAAKNSPAISRNREVLSYMIHLNRPVCLVTDDFDITSISNGVVIHLPEISNLNAGLLEMTVPSLLTGYMCSIIGEQYSRGFRDQWALFKDGCGTCKSEIVV